MKKILFAITGLTIGGAERVLVDLVNRLCGDYDITILTIYSKGELEQEVNKKVKIEHIYDYSYNDLTPIKKKLIGLKFNYKYFLKKLYRKHINNKYDVEIAFLEGPMTYLVASGQNNKKKIAFIHNDLDQFYGFNFKGKLKHIQNEKTYQNFEQLVFVSNDNLEKFNNSYKVNVKKLVINNYLDMKLVRDKAREYTPEFFGKNKLRLLTVCRITEQKGIDRLVRVHKRLIEEGFKHDFYHIGTGPLKDEIQSLINELNVRNSFFLLGSTNNPYPYIMECDLFCLLSNYEGYGMVLVEAKILNKNIVITKTAAVEAVEGYKNSVIVDNDEESIYNGLRDIINNKIKFKKLDNEYQYNNDKIINDIKELIGE